MLKQTTVAQTEEEEQTPAQDENEPPFGSLEWIHYWCEFEGGLPTPIDVSITGSLKYWCPELVWYNFDVYPHKVKLTNTGYTVLLGAKWKAERPFLVGGPFLEKHVFSQIHFHWGSNMMEGSEHSVDKRIYPGEMQATFFKSEYMTQEEALRHPDGVVFICYIIKYGINPDERLQWILEGFPRIQESQTSTRIGPYPLSRLVPMFFEDYFLYWGSLSSVKGEKFIVRWLVPRITLHASLEQMKEFRKLWNPWDEPNLRNFRPLQERQDRHVFFLSPHWSQYNSLLPVPRIADPSISILSTAYEKHPWMLPPQNANLLTQENENKDVNIDQK
ncbi:carbonic anhydrase 2-like [Nymphalis io]|uniref:carbonic anhydrase 2-like n=1 Tax=Inachis io TaxID=171585 RepID=UPI00216A0CF4|nr:carbonic anhydrase 2-like [Nymphalis io]